MTVDARLPVLKASICWLKYDASKPASTALPLTLFPLVPWHAAHEAASICIWVLVLTEAEGSAKEK